MSASILPDDAVFSQFRTLCSSTDNWGSKYDKNGMQVWVEVPPVVSEAQKNAAKIHMIKVGTIVACGETIAVAIIDWPSLHD